MVEKDEEAQAAAPRAEYVDVSHLAVVAAAAVAGRLLATAAEPTTGACRPNAARNGGLA